MSVGLVGAGISCVDLIALSSMSLKGILYSMVLHTAEEDGLEYRKGRLEQLASSL